MLKNKLEQNIVDDLPYHLASSSLAGVTTAFFGGGAGFFLEKRATVLKVEEVEEEGTVLVAPLNLIGLPSISDIPSEAAAVEAAMEAMIMENLLQLKKNLDECVAEFTMKELEIEVVTI
jgi:hypothetical protein